MALQVKMLRFLQERVIERVGGVKTIPVDVRVVCATHQDLENLIQEQGFREDLYYRISEVTIPVPPLRERDGDAVLIAKSLLKGFRGSDAARRSLFLRGCHCRNSTARLARQCSEMINKIKREPPSWPNPSA